MGDKSKNGNGNGNGGNGSDDKGRSQEAKDIADMVPGLAAEFKLRVELNEYNQRAGGDPAAND